MAPSRFKKEARDKREVTPFADDPPNSMLAPPDIPPEWRDIEAPINFTWVVQDELAGMGWPKSRDQVNFLLKQGIDHLITLAADKIPPHYAFPELKWTMIPVEDFTGPLISDIQKFIDIMAKARIDGEVTLKSNFNKLFHSSFCSFCVALAERVLPQVFRKLNNGEDKDEKISK